MKMQSETPSKCRVLVIDENAGDRSAVERMLRARGYRVSTASDGIEARDAVEERSADVVVMDLALGGVSGWELIRKMRGRFEPMPSGKPPRIVVLTRDLAPETERFTRRLGADAVLPKPLDLKSLGGTVQRLANDRAAGRAA